MKRIAFLFLLLIISYFNSKAQEIIDKNKYNLYIEVGFDYKFSDYLPGLEVGALIYSPEKKISIASRNIFMFKIGQIAIDSVNYSQDYHVTDYYTLNYLDLNYIFRQNTKHPLFAGIGFGWIYTGGEQNVKLNKDYGYAVLSLSCSYKVTWFYIDIRGDIPLKSKDSKNVGPVNLFPITIGLSYKFLPKNFE